MFFEKGLNYAEIAKETGNDVKTIKKYIEQDDFGAKGPVKENILSKKKESRLDAFKSTIDRWLEEDIKNRRKQRHTAKRIYTRLIELHGETFGCSYRLVAHYVKDKKEQLYGKKDSYLPLIHIPGEAQVDFGEADFYENDHKFSGYYINISFPYSNAGYLQVFRGQNMQCLAEGLKDIFNHIGGVPTRIWFDNASSVVKKILKNGERELTESFLRFKNHYGFQAAFCNPSSGHEKGSVESKVGYHRRNFLVPVPRFNCIKDYNKELLKLCEKDMGRSHYSKNDSILSLFEKDKESLLVLPSYGYDESEMITIKTNGYAKFTLGGKYTYSTAPQFANSEILVKLTAHEVVAMDKSYREIDKHTRLYGEEKKESMHWLPYLVQLSRRPAALKYSGIYEMLPEQVRDFLEKCDSSRKKDVLTILSELSMKSNFEKATEALLAAIEHGAEDTDSIKVTFNRLNNDVFDFSDFKPRSTLPSLPKINSSNACYDEMLMKGGAGL